MKKYLNLKLKTKDIKHYYFADPKGQEGSGEESFGISLVNGAP